MANKVDLLEWPLRTCIARWLTLYIPELMPVGSEQPLQATLYSKCGSTLLGELVKNYHRCKWLPMPVLSGFAQTKHASLLTILWDNCVVTGKTMLCVCVVREIPFSYASLQACNHMKFQPHNVASTWKLWADGGLAQDDWKYRKFLYWFQNQYG